MLRSRSLVLAVPLLLTTALACGDDPPAATPTSRPAAADVDSSQPDAPDHRTPGTDIAAHGHDRMIAELAAIAARTGEDHPILGTKRLREVRAMAEGLPADGQRSDAVKLWKYVALLEMVRGAYDEGLAALARVESVAGLLIGPARNAALAEAQFWRGVVAMRQAETANCVHEHSSESCLIPLAGRGIHRDPTRGRRAMTHFGRALDLAAPGSWVEACSRWLLNIAAMTAGAYPDELPDELLVRFESDASFPRLAEIGDSVGLAVRDLAGGAVVDDFDGDGLLDVVSSTWDPTGPLRLFRNAGDGTFVERTTQAGLTGITGGLNVVHADYDGDGDLDLLVLRGAWLGAAGRQPNSLLRNDGAAVFTDVTFDAGLAEPRYPTQTAAWADYDGDGDLDVYVGNEGADVDPTLDPYPSQLFRNDGDGTFTDVAVAAGVANLRYAKGVAWGDVDEDGRPDLYVSNLKGANRLYRNHGDGTFTDIAAAAGVEAPLESFATWFWDFDQDGALDLLVQSYPIGQGLVPPALSNVVASRLGAAVVETSRLYRGNGRGGFTDVTAAQGLDSVTLAMGANFGDLDNDGWPDFYLGTGYPGLEGLVPNVLYHNRAGRGFDDVTVAAGMAHIQKGHGVAFADLDNDGDRDVFQQLGGFFAVDRFTNALFENPGFGNHWIGIDLRGENANSRGVGARVRVETLGPAGARATYRTVGFGSSFGGNPLRQVIGLDNAERITSIEVRWPGARDVQTLEGVPLDDFIRIRKDVAGFERLRLPKLDLAGRSGR